MKLYELTDAIETAQAAYHDIVDTGNRFEVAAASDAVKAARAALATELVEGAESCPQCDTIPHGMLQARPGDVVLIEIGCLNCKHHRANGGSPEIAIDKWNAGVKAYKGIEVDRFGNVSGVPKTWIKPKPQPVVEQPS
jgi:plasmid stabilization system protein ParE